MKKIIIVLGMIMLAGCENYVQNPYYVHDIKMEIVYKNGKIDTTSYDIQSNQTVWIDGYGKLTIADKKDPLKDDNERIIATGVKTYNMIKN